MGNADRELLAGVTWPTTVPAFQSLLAQEGERVWVEEFQLDRDGPSRWRIYDLDGRRLWEAEFPAGFRPYYVGKGQVAGVWENDLEVEFIHVYALEDPTPAKTP